MTDFILEPRLSVHFNHFQESLCVKTHTPIQSMQTFNLPKLYRISHLKKEQASLHIHKAGATFPNQKPRVEAYIRLKYREKHNAILTQFSSNLFVGMLDNDIKVAIGIEGLKAQAAFLEHYLQQPVEYYLRKLIQQSISREKIVEIGNLASENVEYAKMMVAFLVYHLSAQGIEWAVCTGTIAVRYVLQQMGLRFHILDRADPDALGEEKRRWGNYYEQKPLVLAIHVADALAVTRENYTLTSQNIFNTGDLSNENTV